jgi:hypothetical protein
MHLECFLPVIVSGDDFELVDIDRSFPDRGAAGWNQGVRASEEREAPDRPEAAP